MTEQGKQKKQLPLATFSPLKKTSKPSKEKTSKEKRLQIIQERQLHKILISGPKNPIKVMQRFTSWGIGTFLSGGACHDLKSTQIAVGLRAWGQCPGGGTEVRPCRWLQIPSEPLPVTRKQRPGLPDIPSLGESTLACRLWSPCFSNKDIATRQVDGL